MILPKTSCEAGRNYSKLSIIKKISVRHVRRLNYLSALRIENYVTKSLSYEEAITEHAAKKSRGKVLQSCVRQLVRKNTVVLFWILCCLRYLSAFLKFAIFSF